MAKYEARLAGDFDQILESIDSGILRGSVSASFEDGSEYRRNGFRLAVRVYERYSMVGKNRVSLSVTLAGEGEDLFLSAITAGGSQAVFFKINTFGEGAFLTKLVDAVAPYAQDRP